MPVDGRSHLQDLAAEGDTHFVLERLDYVGNNTTKLNKCRRSGQAIMDARAQRFELDEYTGYVAEPVLQGGRKRPNQIRTCFRFGMNEFQSRPGDFQPVIS